MTAGLTTLLLLALASTAVVQGQSCDGVLADTLAHPSDCRLYYTLYQMTCPEGELYNTTTRKCGPAEESECGTTTGSSTTPTIPTEPSSTDSTVTGTTGTSTGTTGTGTTGTSTGTTGTGTTGTGTTGTGTTGTGTTGSSTTSTWETTTSVPTEGSTTPKPSRYECPAVDDPDVKIRYAHDTDCELYYLCVEGTATLYRCSADSHFSPTRKSCRVATEAGCDRCPASEVARLPHESVCAYYYKCEEGSATLYACPEPLEFSRSDRQCVSKEDAWCKLEEGVTSTTAASSSSTAGATTKTPTVE